MDPMSLVTQASNAIAIAKKIKGALKKAEHSEILIWVSDLMEEMLDLKNNLVDVKTDNVKLREEVHRLEDELSKSRNWHHDGMRYWKKNEDGSTAKDEGAYCPTCLDSKGKVIRLLESENGYYICKVCDTTYGKWKDIGKSGVRRVRRTYHP